MTLEIILAGQYNLDINDDINVLFTYQVGDVRNFLQSNASFSKSISIAGTSANNLAFQNLFDITNVSNYNPNKKVGVVITDGGVVIFTGYLKVDSIKIDFEKKISYECTVYSQIADMVTNLGQQTLNSLSFSGYAHTYNIHNVTGSWETFIVKENIETPFQLGEGYVYPYIDWSSGFNSGITRSVEFFKPCLYAKTILDAVFAASSGYTYQSDFLNSNYFKSLIVTPNAGGFAIDSLSASNATCIVSQLQENNIVDYNLTGSTVLYSAPSGVTTFTGTYPIVFNNSSTSGNTDVGGNFNVTTYQYTVPVSGQYNIEANINLDTQIVDLSWGYGESETFNIEAEIDYTVTLNYTRGGVEYLIDSASTGNTYHQSITINNGQPLGASSATTVPNFDLIPNPILMAGDVVYASVKYTIRNSLISNNNGENIVAVNPVISVIQLCPSYISIQLQNDNIWENTPVTFTNFLGTDLCSDYVMSIAKMFNLYFEFAPDNPNCLIMEPRQNFYNGDVIDWTYKLDRDNQTESFTMAEITAANFLFTYKQDSDYYNNYYQQRTVNQIYGQYIYYLDNDFIDPTTQDKVDLIFAPTPLINESGSDRIISTIYAYDRSASSPLTNSTPRILFYGGCLPCDQWQIFDGYSGGTSSGATFNENDISSYNFYPYAGYLDNPYNPTEDLNFSYPDFYFYNRVNLTNSNLFNKFWATSIEDISDKTSQLFTGYFKLNTADIQNLSFRNIIFMDSQYWIINKINDYNPLEENLTQVELLRLVNYGQTSRDINVKQQSTNLNLGTIKSLNISGNTGLNIGTVIGNTQTHNLVVGQVNATSTNAVNNVVAGNGNNLTSGLHSAIIAGSNNVIAGNSSNVLVVGDNNSSATQLINAFVLGKNITNPISNAVNANNINLISNIVNSGNISVDGTPVIRLKSSGITVAGSLVQNINYITAGRDVVADEFPQVTTTNFISSGRNKILGFGTNTVVNFISAGRNTV